MGWYEVDKEGLAKLLKRKGPGFILCEMVQDAWDTGATEVLVNATAVPGKPFASFSIEDNDPDGFHDIAHAYRLFAESERKVDPTKRGRFNLGLKLVLANCNGARLISTSGSIYFERDGSGLKRRETKECRPRGSQFSAEMRLTREELAAMLDVGSQLIPPVPTFINGRRIEAPKPIHEFEATLPTEIADDEGFLRPTRRKTTVRVYEKKDTARLYEMGIPVVEIDLPWTVEIMQKVPLNADRDNVTPGYAREVTVLVVNEMHTFLKPEQAALPAIQEALTDERIVPEAVKTVLTHQYGEKRAIFDPSDPEANNRLVAEGFKLIHGGAFSKDAWTNIRGSGAVLPAGKLRPTPQAYSDDPDAKAARFIPEADWTKGMQNLAAYAHELGWKLMHVSVDVAFEKGRMTDAWGANYSHGHLVFNYDRLGKDYFNQGVCEAINDLLIHEFGHEYEGNHLSDAYYKALTKLGAKLWALAMHEPEFFKSFGAK
jgi:hypothetical protein